MSTTQTCFHPPRPLFPFPPPPPPAISVCSSAIPDVDVLTRNVVDILEFEQIPKVCVVGHSYGSFVASRLNMAYRCGVCVWGGGDQCGSTVEYSSLQYSTSIVQYTRSTVQVAICFSQLRLLRGQQAQHGLQAGMSQTCFIAQYGTSYSSVL